MKRDLPVQEPLGPVEDRPELERTLEPPARVGLGQRAAAGAAGVQADRLRCRVARLGERTGLHLGDAAEHLRVHLACRALLSPPDERAPTRS